jgi:hypothetical protein
MSVIVTNRNFRKQTNNEDTNFLLAAKDDVLLLSYRINIKFGFTAIQNQPITITAANTLTLSGGNWNEYGFIVGDTIDIDAPVPTGSPISVTVTILDIQGGVLIHDGSLAEIGQNFPWNNGTNSGTMEVVPNVSTPEAVDVLFNLVPNFGTATANSLIDGEVNRIRFNTTGMIVGANVLGTQLGNRSGGIVIDSECVRISELAGYDFTFEVKIRFKEWLSFEEASPNSQPWYSGIQTIKPFTTNNIYRQLTNPNSVLTFTDNFSLGNVGNYNENYNQGNNPFTFNVGYTVNSQPAAGIAWNAPTDVAITITGSGNFQSGYIVTLNNAPFTDRYKNKPTNFGQNTLMLQILNGTATVFSLSGAQWAASSIVSSVATANTITINFTLTPNSQLISLFEGFGTGDRWLKLSATVQGSGGTATANNRTTLLLYNAEAVTVEPVGGEADEVVAFSALDHVDVDTVTTEGAQTLTEDDILVRAKFRLNKVRNYSAINTKIQVVRDSDGVAFDLLQKTVNALAYPLTNDNKRLINFSESTAFQLPNPNRDAFTLAYNGVETSGNYDIDLNFPFINSWRYWIAKNNALADFLDIALPQNGLNDEWVRYAVSGYSFRLRFEFVRDGLVWFDNRVLEIQDYDLPTTITSTIVIEDLDGNVLTGIPNNQDVIIKAIHVNNVGNWDEAPNIWGWIATRPFEQEPRRLISTEYPWASNNLPLQPLVGELQATKTVVGDTATFEARISAGSVSQNQTLVTRIGTKRGEGNVHKQEVPFVKLPIQVDDEDRGYKRCGEPRLALADVECCDQSKNDVYGVALIADSITVELVSEDGQTFPALGYAVTMPYQENAVGFTIDWRQNLIAYGAGCYRVKVTYDIQGFTGFYFDSNWQLYPYSVTASEETVQLIANYNDSVKELGIDFRGSGFFTGIRFKGFFGNEQINSEHNNNLKANDIRVKVRNYSHPSYDLVTRPLTRCLTRPLKSILLNASDLWVTDCNAYNHEVYKYFNVILAEDSGIELEGEETFVRQLSAVLVDKNWKTESRFSGHAQPPNLSEIIQCSGGGDCDPSDVTVNGVLLGQTECGEEFTVLVVQSGEPIGALNEFGEWEIPPCEDVTLEINGINEGTFASGSTIELNLTDGTNPVTPDDVTVVGNVVTVDLPACPVPVTRSTATPMKTGETVSYQEYDDGWFQAGRENDALTLDVAPFHNDGSPTINTTTNRFTDTAGGQTYANNWILDWSTWNGSTLLGYNKGFLNSGKNWFNSITDSATTTIGGFTGCRLPNRLELYNINHREITGFALGYFPFSFTDSLFIWSSTSVSDTTAHSLVNASGQMNNRTKTAAANERQLPCRTFSLSTSNVLS